MRAKAERVSAGEIILLLEQENERLRDEIEELKRQRGALLDEVIQLSDTIKEML